MRQRIFSIIAAAVMMVAACHGPEQSDPVAVADSVAEAEERPVADVLIEEPKARPVGKARSHTPTKTAAQPRGAQKGKAETIYVETEGAQGRVWGHVTMQGDRGTGTIHDWDENTWTVSVSRHGNELFAVDQNSRQYVFRLRK